MNYLVPILCILTFFNETLTSFYLYLSIFLKAFFKFIENKKNGKPTLPSPYLKFSNSIFALDV